MFSCQPAQVSHDVHVVLGRGSVLRGRYGPADVRDTMNKPVFVILC